MRDVLVAEQAREAVVVRRGGEERVCDQQDVSGAEFPDDARHRRQRSAAEGHFRFAREGECCRFHAESKPYTALPVNGGASETTLPAGVDRDGFIPGRRDICAADSFQPSVDSRTGNWYTCGMGRRTVGAVCAVLSVRLATVFAQGFPADPGVDWQVSDALVSTSSVTARAQWKPLGAAGPVTVDSATDGTPVLRMPCRFSEKDEERAYWERSVSLDLRSCRGLRFLFSCADLSSVSGLSIYLRSGGGWYTASFGPDAGAGWTTVAVDRDATGMEGKPAGWSRIDAIRIAVWRGGSTDTEIVVARFGVVPEWGSVAVVRAESAATTAADSRNV